MENLTQEGWESGTGETDWFKTSLGKIWDCYCDSRGIPFSDRFSRGDGYPDTRTGGDRLPEYIIKEYNEWFEKKHPYTPSEISEELKPVLEALAKKTVVTHFGADLDNVSAIEALERFAIEHEILQEDEHLKVKRVPAGRVMEGFLNVDTGGHTGNWTGANETIVIDGDPSKGINSASAMLANLGIYVPEQIVELADTVPNKVNPLESRTALSLIRSANGSTIFKIAEAGLLDKQLTDEQLEEFGLQDAHKKQEEIITKAVEKINKYMITLPTGEKAVIAPEQILGGAPIAYELGANFYASVEQHKSGNGSTFAVTSKPGIQLPEEIQELGKMLIEQYRNSDRTSGVFLNPNGQMLVAGGPKNPDFSVEYNSEELISKLTELFKIYAERIETNEKKKYTLQDILDGINPRRGEMGEVMEETAREASTLELEPKDPNTKRPGDEDPNPGGDNR